MAKRKILVSNEQVKETRLINSLNSNLLKKEDEKTSQAVSDCQFTVKFYKDKQYESLEQLDGNYDKKHKDK